MAVDFACLYQRFDPAIPLEPGDPTYVDWQVELGMVDVKQQLANSVQLTPGRPVHRLFTGHGGSGKTTELKRVQQRLQTAAPASRYFVSYLEVVELDDVHPTDLVVDMVAGLMSDAKARAGVTIEAGGRLKAFLDAARDALATVPDAGIELKVGDPAGIAELSTTLRRRPSIRAQVRRLLEGPLPTLFDAMNKEVLPQLRSQLAQRGYTDLLVVVDQLDRVPAEGDRHHQLFWEGRGKLKALDCHVVYTVPIEYATSRALPMLEKEYGDLLGLPLLPVNDEPHAAACMAEVVGARVRECGTAWTEVFETRGSLDAIVCLSGGHMRSLFHLLRTAIETSDLVAPLRAAHLDAIVDRTAAKYLDPLTSREREMARLVHRTRARPTDDTQLDCFFDLLRNQYVFAYAVGDRRWYDWNPLLGRSALGPA